MRRRAVREVRGRRAVREGHGRERRRGGGAAASHQPPRWWLRRWRACLHRPPSSGRAWWRWIWKQRACNWLRGGRYSLMRHIIVLAVRTRGSHRHAHGWAPRRHQRQSSSSSCSHSVRKALRSRRMLTCKCGCAVGEDSLCVSRSMGAMNASSISNTIGSPPPSPLRETECPSLGVSWSCNLSVGGVWWTAPPMTSRRSCRCIHAITSVCDGAKD